METQLSKRRKSSDLQRAASVLDERVTLRSMALADLECELQEETCRRLALEERIGGLEAQLPRNNSDLSQLLVRILGSFEAVVGSAMAAKPVNPADAFEIKEMLTRASAMIEVR